MKRLLIAASVLSALIYTGCTHEEPQAEPQEPVAFVEASALTTCSQTAHIEIQEPDAPPNPDYPADPQTGKATVDIEIKYTMACGAGEDPSPCQFCTTYKVTDTANNNTFLTGWNVYSIPCGDPVLESTVTDSVRLPPGSYTLTAAIYYNAASCPPSQFVIPDKIATVSFTVSQPPPGGGG